MVKGIVALLKLEYCVSVSIADLYIIVLLYTYNLQKILNIHMSVYEITF